MVTLLRVYEYLYLIPNTVMTAILMFYYLIRIFSKRKKYLVNIISSITLLMIVTYILALKETQNHIIYKAIKNYKQVPYHVHLNLDYPSRANGVSPNAVMFKGNDVYYWSFKKDDFYHYGLKNHH
jgi:hypothetical protein